MEPYCATCPYILKTLDSCPRSYIFDEGNFLNSFLEIVWVGASLYPFFVIILLCAYFLYKRTTRLVFILFMYLVTQVITSAVLKQIFREPRPPGACSSSFGFPSGHAASASSWLLWLVLEWVILHDKVPFKLWKYHGVLRNLAIMVIPLIPASRYFLNYHTIKQILFGLLVGLICTAISFYTMLVMIYKEEGKFWSSKVLFVLKKIKGKDNLVELKNINDITAVDQEGGQEAPEKEIVIVFPLKEYWRKLLMRNSDDNNRYFRINSGSNGSEE